MIYQKDRLLQDHGNEPVVLPLQKMCMLNDNFRLAVWTGEELQATLMSIPRGGSVGAEVHSDEDQLLYIVSGRALVKEGEDESNLSVKRYASLGEGVFVPKGTWHELQNASPFPLKILSVYAPPHHPKDTVQPTSEQS